MELAIQLYGYLILTFLGVVTPIMVILLSMFREGMRELTVQYENEKSQSEKNIKRQINKQEKAEKIDAEAIQQILYELKAIKKTAGRKLSYLNPKRQTIGLFITLLISFLGVILALLTKTNFYYMILFVALSLICFNHAIFAIWGLLGVIIEVKTTLDENRKDSELKIVEVLSKLVEEMKSGLPYFLKKIYITVDDEIIKKDKTEAIISVSEKQRLKIGIRNLEKRMAKNVEIGFIFPLETIIEKTDYYSIYTDKKSQIVRYYVSSIQGDTHRILGHLIITTISIGDIKVRTFIKAENIESTYRILNLKVTSLLGKILEETTF